MSKKKTKVKTLKQYLAEEYDPTQLAPLSPPATGNALQPTNISIDRKIDRYFIQYERESSPLAQKFGGATNSNMSANLEPMPTMAESLSSFLLREAPGDEEDPLGASPETLESDLGIATEENPSDASSGSAEPPGGSKGNSSLPPQINISLFTQQVARLASNFDNLVDPVTTLLLRAQDYIAKNYNPQTAKEMMNILQQEFGLTPKTEKQKVSDFGSVPIASGAAADISGGG